jgi:uncharacterized membrane protein
MISKNVNIPPGYSFNPSTWKKRLPLLALALAGFLIALYLGFYQLHLFNKVWEPFFGNGTRAILESSFSRSLPVPDGLVGAFAYLCDIILVSAGNENRWQSKPWIVILYSILVGIMGLVSVFLVILQAFILHSWCTLCLASAALSLSMVLPVSKEFFATFHFLEKENNRGKPVWEAIEGS